ncbi:MAG TPA: single-stranded DNA-binding protein [Pirellulales bacterium]|jgi:single-strand DNA-binding protein|nr:single-stranded DNA-binding protein [Pirellulales bacterium]
MASFNRVVLVGNLTRDPELRYTPSGMAVTDVTLAVNDKRKGANGEWVEEVTFVDVTLWGRTAEVVTEYTSKGSPLLIEGRLKQDKWQDKSTGENRSKLKVVGERMQLLGSKSGGGGGGGGGRPAGGGRAPANDEGEYGPPADFGEPSGSASGPRPPDDDIPF